MRNELEVENKETLACIAEIRQLINEKEYTFIKELEVVADDFTVSLKVNRKSNE
jgi:hypothetical protein